MSEATINDFPTLHAAASQGHPTECGRENDGHATSLLTFADLANRRHRPANLCGSCIDAMRLDDESGLLAPR